LSTRATRLIWIETPTNPLLRLANIELIAVLAHTHDLAESLGGVGSLIELPAQMTHASTHGSVLEVPPNLIRLSVGIEHADDLRDDLGQALCQEDE